VHFVLLNAQMFQAVSTLLGYRAFEPRYDSECAFVLDVESLADLISPRSNSKPHDYRETAGSVHAVRPHLTSLQLQTA
jgi:hypothetical protein